MMELDRLKEYYEKIGTCTVELKKELDLDFVQEQIAKTGIFTEKLNTILAEILVELSTLEHDLTDTRFEYELTVTKYLIENSDVKKISTSKERKDYINYFLLKDDYRKIVDLEQNIRDVEKLVDLAKKKARDLDKTYPKLKTLWESVSSEMKHIKKIGSDFEYIERVRDKISNEENNNKPIFEDSAVESLIIGAGAAKEEVEEESIFQSLEEEQTIKDEVEDLIRDL